MRTHLAAIVAVLALSPFSYGQAVAPVVVSSGPVLDLPVGDGTIHYDLSAADIYETGYDGNGGNANIVNLSGDVAYISRSTVKPFTMVYSGGWLGSTTAGIPSTTFQNLSVSQGLIARRWALSIGDSFSYLPEAPSIGLSGIPGVGDVGLGPFQGGYGPSPTVLTNSSTLILNMVTGSASRQLTYNTSLNVGGSQAVEHFLGQAGLNNSQLTGSVGLNRRLDARDSVGLAYVYTHLVSDFGYTPVTTTSTTSPGINSLTFHTQSVSLSFQRQWTRTVSVSASAGPQWISSSDNGAIPATVNAMGSAAIIYVRRFSSASLSYTRGANGGFGVLPGAFADSVQASAQQAIGRNWRASATATYLHISGLGNNLLNTTNLGNAFPLYTGAGNTKYAGAQLSRQLGHAFSTYVSYTAQLQSFDQSLGTQNAFSGFSQLFGIGITYSPRSKHLGQL